MRNENLRSKVNMPLVVKTTCLAMLLLMHSFFIFSQVQQGKAAGKNGITFTHEMTGQFIDSIRAVLTKRYIFQESAVIMSAYLDSQYKNGAYNLLTTSGELGKKIFEDLQKAHPDKHFRLKYDPETAKQLLVPFNENQQKVKDSINLFNMRNNNYNFNKVEILPGNIGYVEFTGFTELVKDARPTVTAAFRFVMHTKSLIIDLRNNHGGSPDMVNQVESYFFPVKMHMNDIVTRSPDSTIVFQTDPEKADSVILNMPVYILTSRTTFSGAEDFAYAMQSTHRAVIVGDTTGGGAHPTALFNIGFGFIAGVPIARSVNPYTNTDWEGTGIYPDIPVPVSYALSAAEKAIYKGEINKAGSAIEKQKLEWSMKYLLSQQSLEVADSAELVKYTGLYEGGLNFYVNGHYLYCENRERANRVYQLKYILPFQFVLDDKTEIEFIQDKAGKIEGCHLLASNGEVVNRTKQ
ncbi:MAG: S41 family peptidase [Bacteroidota bacterium]